MHAGKNMGIMIALTKNLPQKGGCSRGTVPIWVPGVRARTTTAVAHRVQGYDPLFR